MTRANRIKIQDAVPILRMVVQKTLNKVSISSSTVDFNSCPNPYTYFNISMPCLSSSEASNSPHLSSFHPSIHQMHQWLRITLSPRQAEKTQRTICYQDCCCHLDHAQSIEKHPWTRDHGRHDGSHWHCYHRAG